MLDFGPLIVLLPKPARYVQKAFMCYSNLIAQLTALRWRGTLTEEWFLKV